MNSLKYIQITISPTILVSALGLLLLSQTNRYSSLTSRFRSLSQTDQKLSLYKRIRILKYSILSLLLGLLTLMLLMLYTFCLFLLDSTNDTPLIFLFIISCIFVVISIILFIHDMFSSLNAINMSVHVEFN